MRSDRASLGMALAMSLLAAGNSLGNPSGGTVRQGTATFNSSGSQLTITTSAQAYINWQSFNIGVGETTTFVQPSSSSLVWNQINDPNPSQILGTLNANGYVVLQNQNGFFIGGQAAISTHGLIMTTTPISMPDLSAGGPWDFRAPPPTASIINYGQINVGNSSAFLIANDVENHGSINAPGGNIGLYAGQDVLVSTRPDGRGLSATVTLPQGSVDNSGKLIADGGTIALHAQVVNQGGLVQANTAQNVNGTIQLLASDAVNLGANSVISAQGDSQGVSSGGSVTVKSDNTFSDQAGSKISVAGGAQGGNGGQLEISAENLGGMQSQIDGHAASGFVGGSFTIDPTDFTIDSTYINGLAPGLSQINVQATGKITVATLWNLGNSANSAQLNISAGNSIIFNTGTAIIGGNNWNLNLWAGPQNLTSKPASQTDGIYLNGTSYLQTQNGNINLWAANEVLINPTTSTAAALNGIRTMGGGSIDVTAEFGNVNTGGNTSGYTYSGSVKPYYFVSPTLGGISTAAGGNVTITAGGDVISLVPSGTTIGADAGTGCFGSQAGNVSITAGGNVYGHYVLANGVGTITAGANAGGLGKNTFALSLINGSWNVNAPYGNIFLQEVRNPNGIFNKPSSSTVAQAPGNHLFNYGDDASVSLDAGIGVYLTAQNLPRVDPNGFTVIPVIYPPILDITAGSGGVTLESDLVLFPSPDQGLNITTTAGGNFVSQVLGNQAKLIMSDSGAKQWADANGLPDNLSGTFGYLDHSGTLQLNNLQPAVLDISGSMENMTLITTKETQINIGGDMVNVNFSGQNLHAGDTTSIHVGGQISYTSLYSFIFLPNSIPAIPADDLPPGSFNNWDSIFLLLMNPQTIADPIPSNILPADYATWAQHSALFFQQSVGDTGNPGFVYDPATGRFGFQGPMPTSVFSIFTQPLTVVRYGPDGNPMTTTTTDPVTHQQVTHFVTDTINWAPSAEITALYNASQQSSTTAQYGLRVGGPGQFDVTAGSLSLGNSDGILAEGVWDIAQPFGTRYQNLASVTPSGANLNITVDGNVDMVTSTIGNTGGGSVSVTSLEGSMNLGSADLPGQPRAIPVGIYSTGAGDVNVIASGDVDINGSRIAAYDGGNITVESLHGDVNAGSGVANRVQVSVAYVDPITGLANLFGEQAFGAGILANTLINTKTIPGSPATPGNITVTTPQGNISANEGGIVQEALNGNVSAGPTVTLTAGTMPTDGSPGYKGNIDLGTSGVIGGTVTATANGTITGLVISRQNSSINAANISGLTVLSGGSASLSAQSISDTTAIGVGGVNVQGTLGQGVTALGQNVSVNGGAAQSTLGTTATATAASQSAANTATSDAKEQVASNGDGQDDDKKKKGNGPLLAHRVGRVTVLLPANS